MLLGKTLVLGHWVVGHNFTLEDPNLDPADTVGGESRAFAIIHLGTQGMKRHATFAVPFGTSDLGTAKTTCAVDPDALCAKTHSGLDRALHGTTEADTALKLLCDILGNQLGVDFRLANLNDVQADLAAHLLRQVGAQGVRINCAGRLGGAEIARTEWYREGRVPLHTLRAEVDYGEASAFTTYGVCGIKVWVFKGEVMAHDPMAQDKRLAEQQSGPAPRANG